MKLLFVYDGDWPKAAIRVEKITKTLEEAGHTVCLLCRNATRRARSGREPWMTVRRLPVFPTEALNSLLNFPFFFNPVWIFSIWKEARRFQAEGIFVQDLPLAPAALLVGRVLSVPVLYDMGEVYPEFLRGLRQFKELTVVDRLIRNPGPADVLERMVLKRADFTFVVSEESKARAIGRGASEGEVAVVGNTPYPANDGGRVLKVPPGLEELGRRPVALFVGILISDRGLGQAVRAMALVKDEIPDALLVVVGDGLERPGIEEEIRRRGLRDQVRMEGWKNPEEIPAYYAISQVGLLPFLDGGQIRYTLANKLFDYWNAGLPVVASDVPPMRRVLSECEGGVLVPPGDPEGLARGILEVLHASEDTRQRMGASGRALVADRYNWDVDGARLKEAVGRVLAKRREL